MNDAKRAELYGYADDLVKNFKLWGLKAKDAIVICKRIIDIANDPNREWKASNNHEETLAVMRQAAKDQGLETDMKCPECGDILYRNETEQKFICISGHSIPMVKQ